MTERKTNKMRDGAIQRGGWWYYVIRLWDPKIGRTKPVWHGRYRTRKEALQARREALMGVDHLGLRSSEAGPEPPAGQHSAAQGTGALRLDRAPAGR